MPTDTVPVDHMLYETNQHGRSDFPIQFYVDELHKFENRKVPLHWHFEPEFFVALGGVIKVQVGNQYIELKPNEGIYINCNTLHSFEQVNKYERCQCPNIVFSAEMIAPHTSIIYQKYIRPILVNRQLPYFILRVDILWQKEILDHLAIIFSLLHNYGHPSPYGPFPDLDYNVKPSIETCFEMQVQNRLSRIWQSIFTHSDLIPTDNIEQRNLHYQLRLQLMISYIQRNYMNPVKLQDISNSANISTSEASRCFNSYLKCSPVEYLLQYRIKISQRLLNDSTRSIQEVGLECGFNSSSYFIKVFKKKVGMTPREYRSR